jgi:signal transduction histidine kinase
MKQRTNGTTVPQKVLVTSDQNGFSRDLIARWQMQPHVPEFTALSSDLLRSGASLPFDVAIVGDVRPERTAGVLAYLNQGSIPTVYVASVGEPVHTFRRDYARLIVVPRHDAWLDTVVLLTEEILKRAELSAHISRVEEGARAGQKHATLGRYMVEMRHSFNNALTSVLGNAELLLLETTALKPNMRDQLETLHAMTLRLHEMMQRFTSLEVEMQCTEKSSRSEKVIDPISYATRV